jgi:PAS domain S-box-containing protein
MLPLSPGESAYFLSTLRPGPVAWRIALIAVGLSAAVFIVVLPFAQVQLPAVVAFVSIYQSAIIINDVITAALLFGQFAILGAVSLAALASGFLLAAVLASVQMLTFPGLFTPTGLFGAGTQTTAWLYMFWHSAFAAGAIAYALLSRPARTPICPRPRRVALIAACVTGVAALVFAILSVTTVLHDRLPVIIVDNRYTSIMIGVVSTVVLINLLALVVLWRRRPRTVLDLWILVAACAIVFEVALAAVFNAGRFDLGFYVGRIFGLAASSFVLLMLLLENSVLYARLVRAADGERAEFRRAQQKSAEIAELNASLERRVAERTGELDASNRDLRAEVANREKAEREGREARDRLDGIIDSAMDAIITVDDEQHVVLFNSAAEAMFRCPQKDALGSPLAQFLPERYRAMHADHVREFGEHGVRSRRMARQRIVRGLRRNGEEFPIDASISQVAIEGRKYFTIILRDITERMDAEQALQRSRDELHEIARVSATAREQEKQRIARELHDELAQSLAMLGMDLNWLKGTAGGDPAAATRIATMQKLLSSTVAATRRIAADLRPLVLDDLGLVAAAQWLVEKFKDRHGIDCAITVSPERIDIDDPHATAIFRIMQEALQNVAKHAQATRVDVTLALADGHVTLCVRDNGRGFDTAAPRKNTSFGLVGLRERAHLIAADLRVESAPGQGTRIDVAIPLAPQPVTH